MGSDISIKNKDELLTAFLTESLGDYQLARQAASNDAEIKAYSLETMTARLDGMKKGILDDKNISQADKAELTKTIADINKDLPKYLNAMHDTLTSGAQEVVNRENFKQQIAQDYEKNPDGTIHPEDKEAVFQRAMQVAASESVYAQIAAKKLVKGEGNFSKTAKIFEAAGLPVLSTYVDKAKGAYKKVTGFNINRFVDLHKNSANQQKSPVPNATSPSKQQGLSQ